MWRASQIDKGICIYRYLVSNLWRASQIDKEVYIYIDI